MKNRIAILYKHTTAFSWILFFSLVLNVNGQTLHEIKQHIFNQIDIRNQNWNISQNPHNRLIYFANSEGLVEYNGITSKLYSLPYEKGARSVCVDSNGVIFTGAFEEMGYWEPKPNGNLNYHSLSALTHIQKNDEIWKIYTFNHKVYFQSFTTIYIYDYQKITSLKTPFNMLFLLKVNNRFIVQGIDQGLYWFDGLNFTFINGSELFGTTKVHSIIEKADGSIMICTASNGIFLFNGHNFITWKSEASDFLKLYTCNAGSRISDSLFVFGSILNGVIVCDAQGKIRNHYNFSNGLKNNTVLAIFTDCTKGLWIGLDEGVNYIDILSPTTYYTNTSGTLGTIYTVYKNNHDLLLGTNHGLFKASIEESNDNFVFSNIHIIPGSQGQIWELKKFNNQVLCGHNDGTFKIEKNNFQKISNVTGGWSIQPIGDKLMEGTYTGLVTFDKDLSGNWKFCNRVEGYGEPTRHVEIDYLGYIWASHAMKGLYKMELNDKHNAVTHIEYFNNINKKPHNIDVFSINNRILFTNSEDLYTYDYVNNKIVPFSPMNEQIGEFRQSTQIIPFCKNTYWFIHNNKIGLFEISIGFKARKILELQQENPNISGRDLQIIALNDRVLLIPNRQGFSTYNFGFSAMENNSSHIFIQQLAFKGQKKNRIFGYEGNQKISVPYNINNLTVYFADPSRFGQKNKTYYYRIPEIEESWHSTMSDNFTYLNIRFGNYRIQIKSDMDEKIVEIPFEVLTPWYLSWPAFAVYLCILAGLVYLGIHIFKFELSKQKQLLEYKTNKNKLENELNYKNQELLFSLRYLIQKNEILTELKTEIDSMKEELSRYPIKYIKKLESIIHIGLESQTEEWKNALRSLKLSEQGFFKKLLEIYPDLTTNDLRLCSYLRMNFSTKEIAKLLNISSRGVEISRYRLRKKMKLEHDENLTEFLMSLAFDEKG
jgi:DNA-binding CsgD family transcriptional regulator